MDMSPEHAYGLRIDGCNGSYHAHLRYHGRETDITLTLKDDTVWAEAHGHSKSGFDVNSLKNKSKQFLKDQTVSKLNKIPTENRRQPSEKAYPLAA